MARASAAAEVRAQGEQPRWLASMEQEGPTDPLGVYAETYGAIDAVEPWERPARPWKTIGLAFILLLALAGWAALVWFRVASVPGLRTERAAIPTPRGAYAPELIGTTPVRPKAVVRVGEEREFAVAATGPDLRYGWTIDGSPAGTGPRWSFAPQPGDVGRKRVEVVVTGREGAERRAWAVLVRPARTPRVLAEPEPGSLELAADATVRLQVDAEPTSPSERLSTTWQVDGRPAGNGEAFTFRGTQPGVRVVSALVRSDLGPTVTRQWRIDVAPPPVVARAPEPRIETRTSASPPEPQPATAAAPEPQPAIAAREPQPAIGAAREPEVVARRVEPERSVARPTERPGREEEVRRWLERYAAAWRAHDVTALRRMGQVTTEDEAEALRAYFDRVRDLDVELNVVALLTDGDRTIVRFTRRDRFRDPAGRLVVKESPMLEKQVVRTSDGLRFAPPSG